MSMLYVRLCKKNGSGRSCGKQDRDQIGRWYRTRLCGRCLQGLRTPQCSKVCPTDALVPKKGGGVSFHPDKCIGCELCVKACPIGAVFWDIEIKKPMICIACGYCVKYCPCSVLALEEIPEREVAEVENA